MSMQSAKCSRKYYLAGLWPALVFFCNPAIAAPSGELNMATTFAALIFVLCLILGLGWLAKKMRLPGTMGGQGNMRIISQMPVGQRERIAVVQVGEEQLVVGITSQNITLLKTLEKPLEEKAGGGKDFASQLGQIIRKNNAS